MYSKLRLSELQKCQVKTKHHLFFIELTKILELANFRFRPNFRFLTVYLCCLSPGEYFTVFTDYDSRMLTDVFITTNSDSFEFQVKACTGAVVAITTANTEQEENEYFIVIGDSNNQQTTVQQRQQKQG